MSIIFFLLLLFLIYIIINNFYDCDIKENLENKNDSSCLNKDPLFLALNNAAQINLLQKEVSKLNGINEKVDNIDNKVNILQKGLNDMVQKIGNQGFGSAGRNMKNIKDPPPNIQGLN